MYKKIINHFKENRWLWIGGIWAIIFWIAVLSDAKWAITIVNLVFTIAILWALVKIFSEA